MRTTRHAVTVIALAALVASGLGLRLREPAARAGSTDGPGRAHLVVFPDGEGESPPLYEAYVTLLHAPTASRFGGGALLRAELTTPGAQRIAVMTLDVADHGGLGPWTVRRGGLEGRWYEVDPQGHVAFDGALAEADLDLEAAASAGTYLAFRYTGHLRFEGPGGARVVAATLESTPSPESLREGTAGPGALPPAPICPPETCYESPAYGEGFEVVAGCSEADYAYEPYEPAPEESGCETHGGGEPSEPDPWTDDDGWDSSGCEGDTWDDSGSDSGGGCEGDSADGGDWDGGGCEGDTY